MDDTPLEETLTALDYAVSTGRAAYVGVSNYAGWQSAQAATWQRAVPGRATLASNQVEYSLVNRRAETEVLPGRRGDGLGVLPWSPLGRGVLDRQVPPRHPGRLTRGLPALPTSSAATSASGTPGSSRRSPAPPRGWTGRPSRWRSTWVRDRPGVVAPIVGARTAAQLRGSLTIEELELPAQIVAALDDVSGRAEV